MAIEAPRPRPKRISEPKAARASPSPLNYRSHYILPLTHTHSTPKPFLALEPDFPSSEPPSPLPQKKLPIIETSLCVWGPEPRARAISPNRAKTKKAYTYNTYVREAIGIRYRLRHVYNTYIRTSLSPHDCTAKYIVLYFGTGVSACTIACGQVREGGEVEWGGRGRKSDPSTTHPPFRLARATENRIYIQYSRIQRNPDVDTISNSYTHHRAF